MIFDARTGDSRGEVDNVSLGWLREVVAVVERLPQVRVTPASVDCGEGYVSTTREEMSGFGRSVAAAVLKMVHGRRRGGLGVLVKMVVGIGLTATAIEPRTALTQTL